MLKGELFLYGLGPFAIELHDGFAGGTAVLAVPGCNIYATWHQLRQIRDEIDAYLGTRHVEPKGGPP